MSDHDESEYGVRDLDLPDGRFHLVDERLHPYLSEWDWRYDEASHQIVREEAGKKVYLFHEELRWHRKAGHTSPRRPVLPRLAIRTQFAHLPVFTDMLLYSMRQREFIQFQVGCSLPSPTELLAETMTEALLQYLTWKDRGQTVMFTPDPENLLPGGIASIPRTESPPYRTLGEWMDGELTGRWCRDADVPTGLSPETYRRRVTLLVRRQWHRVMRLLNWEDFNSRDIELILQDADLPVRDLAEMITDLLSHTALP